MNKSLSDYDIYQMSKYYPGKYSPKSTYAPSGDLTAAVAVKGGFAINSCTLIGTATAATLGTYAYTLIMYCPILSHLAVANTVSPIYSGGVAGSKQASGLVIVGSDSVASVVTIGEFFGTTADGSAPVGQYSTLAQQSVLGFTSDVNLDCVTYASRFHAKMVIPAANLTGTMYRGTLRLGQLFQAVPSATVNPGLPLSAFIRAADHIEGMQTGFDLQSAIVNDYILTHSLRNGADNLVTVLKDVDLGSEIVSFVVLQTPAINITNGTNSNFSLICELESNIAVMPSMNNLLMYRTFTAMTHHKQLKEMDFPYSPIDPKLLNSIPPPTTLKELKVFEDKIDQDIQESGIKEETVALNNGLQRYKVREHEDEKEWINPEQNDPPPLRDVRDAGLRSGKKPVLPTGTSDSEEEDKIDTDRPFVGIHFMERKLAALIITVGQNQARLSRFGYHIPKYEPHSLAISADMVPMALSAGLTILKGLISSESVQSNPRVKQAREAYKESIEKKEGTVQSSIHALLAFLGSSGNNKDPEIKALVKKIKSSKQV